MSEFSIVIPVYNVAQYLRECLDSVLEQSLTDWEAICVDDGSTDGSGAILDEYAARDVRFMVVHQANAGVSAARNAGMALARGEWLVFVDADDWVDKAYLQDFSERSDKADVTFFPVAIESADGTPDAVSLAATGILRERPQMEEVIHSLALGQLHDAFGWTWNKIWRRSVLGESSIRFPQDVDYLEDELFAVDGCRLVKSLQVCDKAYYHYRQTAEGLTRKGGGRSDCGKIAAALIQRADAMPSSRLRDLCIERSADLLFSHFATCRSMRVSNKIISLIRSGLPSYETSSWKRHRMMYRLSRLPWGLRHILMWLFLAVHTSLRFRGKMANP